MRQTSGVLLKNSFENLGLGACTIKP